MLNNINGIIMINGILDKIKSRLSSNVSLDNLSDDTLLNPDKLERHLKKQTKRILSFKKETNSDLKKFTRGIEKSIGSDLEKSFKNIINDIGQSNQKILKNGNRLSSFGTLNQSVDFADIVAGNVTNLVADSLGSVLENGLNLAISNAFTRKTVKSFETDRSKNASREFGLSRKQQSAAASVELSNSNSNL